jgi:hypothetical protein
MASPRTLASLVAACALPGAAAGHPAGPAWSGVGSLVRVSLEVCGSAAPLYAARDGSGRHYLEAREGCSYVVRLENRTGQRLGVVLAVDGLNAVSGERDHGRGRMYVLDAWGQATVEGWRTSLDEVRRFTFVDERGSYAARSGKANSRMGWIEATVYRERRPWTFWPWRERIGPPAKPSGSAGRDEARERAAPPSTAAPDGDAYAGDAYAGRPSPEADERLRGLGYVGGDAPRSYPGTGWGQPALDRVEVVDFDPEARPAERVTLRYEYADALLALGILPRPWHARDRLMERERGSGFAKPPRF